MGLVKRALSNATKVGEALHARIALRKCSQIGGLTRLVGSVIVSNGGTLRIGRRVRLNGKPVPIELIALSGAELTIGDGTSINRGVSICAKRSIHIGSNCGIGNDVLIFDTDFHAPGDTGRVAMDAAPVAIGDNVWLASRSMILKGVTIGDGAVVCAGSVVATSVAPHTMVGGVPARLIRKLTEAEGAPQPARVTLPATHADQLVNGASVS